MRPSSWWPILLLGDQVIAQWIDYPDHGPASLTHYNLPTDFIAACGCTAESTHYPTAALSQMAYGSSADYGAHISLLLYLVIDIHFSSRARLWKVLQSDPASSSDCNTSVLSTGGEKHCCQGHRPLPAFEERLLFWHNYKTKFVSLAYNEPGTDL